MGSRYLWQTLLRANKKDQARQTRQGKTRTFVENEQLASAYDRTCERQDLPLANGEVAPTARNLAIERQMAIIVVAL